MSDEEDKPSFSSQNYVTPGNPVSFGGRNLVYRYFRPDFKNYAQVEQALSKIDAYTRHRSAKPPKYNPYFLYSPRQLIQCDLCDKQDLKEFNDGYAFWLVCIDCFTRKVWLKPLKRKTDAMVIPAMREILNEINENGSPVKLCETDRGVEFSSRQWRALMREFNIRSRYCNTHSAFVERVLQTLQRMLAFYMTQNETRTYIHVLDKIVDGYNDRFHRMIKMSPNNAEKIENLINVRYALEDYYQKAIHRKRKPKYKVNDWVRAVKKGVFKRSYDEQFDVDFYIIHDIKKNLPFPMYILKSPEGNVLSDLYYEEEITPYTNEEWKIEKVIKRRKRGRRRESLVKWLGFSDANNSWVDDSQLGEKFQRQA